MLRKKLALITAAILLLAIATIAQEQSPKLVDSFGVLPCGDFMARMDNLLNEYKDSDYKEIRIIYYGGRFRRRVDHRDWNQATRRYEKVWREYPHQDDGVNWANAILLYLTTTPNYPANVREIFKEGLVLVNGGFREKTEVEIWLLKEGSDLPKSVPTIDEKNIRFRSDLPYRTPNFSDCYSGL